MTAIKSMLGEALGASGGLQVVALLGTLRTACCPASWARARPKRVFPLPGLATAAAAGAVRRALVTALSADGHACAVVLGAPGGSG